MSNLAVIKQPSIMATMAAKFNVPEAEMLSTLKATAFKGSVSDAQMTALLIVANQYGLNPWTKEIYAYPDKNNGIVPVVGVDGWARIINEHPQFDGLEFIQDDESCTCIIYRKDRSHPIKVTEYKSECNKNTGPWSSHPKRMLRHKALIQCARLAMGYVGIYDEDEADRIIEKDVTPRAPTDSNSPPAPPPPVANYPEADFNANFFKWAAVIQSGKKTAIEIINMIESKAPLTEAQRNEIMEVNAPITGEIA
jgi:phage recombination protein Bet